MKLNTSKEIIVIPNKTLKLTNPLIKELTMEEIKNFNQTLMVFQGVIKSRNLQVIGPLITYTASVIEDGVSHPVMKIITQLKEAPKGVINGAYEFHKEIKIKNCLYTRFTGNQRYLQIAIMKMKTYAYENDLELKDDYYSIMLSQNEGNITVDLFMEVVNEE